MSFLRKVRNSISRGNSSTRDSTPNSRRSSSIESHNNNNKRRDSIESKPGEGLQRSETFTIENDKESILKKAKPTKKQKAFNKFGTYTRARKTPEPPEPATAVEEVNDNTYYSWKSGIVADPAEAARDPFNVLYEQPSSLQSDLSGYSDSSCSRKQGFSDNNNRKQTQPIDSSTFKKNRVSRQLREQLEQLKNPPEISEEIENDPEKFRTITINSFRRSFREKFLAKQNEVPHNPSWFVGVDPPPEEGRTDEDKDRSSQQDKYVYDNESYRPTSRSPVRIRTPLQNMYSVGNISPTRSMPPVRNISPVRDMSPVRDVVPPIRPARTNAISSVRRTETCRIERPPVGPSVRIEIKNSITPNQPGRMVPVGVAKPMPSQVVNPQQPTRNSRYDSPGRGWNQQSSQRNHEKQGRYQTCIQITSSDPTYPINKEPTRVRISGNERSPLRYINSKRNDHHQQPMKKQIYFGDNIPPPIMEMHGPVKYRQQQQYQLDVNSYNTRPSRPTSGIINRNEPNRYYSNMTQSVPRRSRSPIKVPWR
ncbi:uncharacterized protein LOC129908618 [Episyrphus balteatus]|uniref:uncharacterized protein LOC129908618 n=1 Tax=Episyrphus balteatus TaxID=286459 RepID=UPI002485E046|nr:uncharacterized protein LOC129908618 [Episyrphus balteatus]